MELPESWIEIIVVVLVRLVNIKDFKRRTENKVSKERMRKILHALFLLLYVMSG